MEDTTGTQNELGREIEPINSATAWAELARIGAELSAMGLAAVSSGDEIAAMRR